MEDQEIIGLLFARDERGISAAGEKYGAYCRTVAGNILDSPEDAEECVNDALLRAWNAIPPERPRLLGAYLAGITRNAALSRWRREHADKRGGGTLALALEELDGCLAGPASVEGALDARELTAALNGFLDGLEREARYMFLRRYWYADPIKVIARESGKSEGAVTKTLSRSREKLRCYLKERGFST